MSQPRSRARRAVRWLGRSLLLLLALYLVGRAVVEVLQVDPSRPETYRQDWGGPHYLGVLLVHAGPGIVVLGLAVVCARRRSRRRRPAAIGPSSRRPG